MTASTLLTTSERGRTRIRFISAQTPTSAELRTLVYTGGICIQLRGLIDEPLEELLPPHRALRAVVGAILTVLGEPSRGKRCEVANH
jgi:hypothetical protein